MKAILILFGIVLAGVIALTLGIAAIVGPASYLISHHQDVFAFVWTIFGLAGFVTSVIAGAIHISSRGL